MKSILIIATFLSCFTCIGQSEITNKKSFNKTFDGSEIPYFNNSPEEKTTANESEIDYFIQLIEGSKMEIQGSLDYIDNNWKIYFIPMLIETIYLNKDYSTNEKFIGLLSEKTHQSFGFNIHDWYKWMWNEDIMQYEEYALFKSNLYKRIDPKFEYYFKNSFQAKIDLREIMWGGVMQDGIPPLRKPKMIAADEASCLDDSNIVFGIEIEGDARAYPKRILAWHEMFVDSVGSKSVTGVYCTLCGTMILYNNELYGTEYKMGTSGFLYRSNKLMYDQAIQSLWNTFWGEPVVGPLTNKGIELEKLSVVTTTWGAWKKRHPDTKVLSLNTGFRRNYDEGIAYKEYFAKDDLMFNVKSADNRLKNKAEVLGLVFPQAPNKALAISSEFLREKSYYHTKVKDLKMIVITDDSGAHRVYETNGVKFKSWDSQKTLEDENGEKWSLSEPFLISENGLKLYRLPSHNAFWFGWHSAYPYTKLIK